MPEFIDRRRRQLLTLGAAVTGGFAMEFGQARAAENVAAQVAVPSRAASSRRLDPLRSIDAGVLNIAYY